MTEKYLKCSFSSFWLTFKIFENKQFLLDPAVFLKNGVDLENGPHVDLVKKGPVVADLDHEAKNLGLQNGLDQETKNQGPEKENVQLHEAKKEVDPGLSLVLNLDRGGKKLKYIGN